MFAPSSGICNALGFSHQRIDRDDALALGAHDQRIDLGFRDGGPVHHSKLRQRDQRFASASRSPGGLPR